MTPYVAQRTCRRLAPFIDRFVGRRRRQYSFPRRDTQASHHAQQQSVLLMRALPSRMLMRRQSDMHFAVIVALLS